MLEDDSGWRLEQKMENEIFNFAFLPDECTIFYGILVFSINVMFFKCLLCI